MAPLPDCPHILLVDDDRRLRALLRKYLTDQKYCVTEAASAADARSLLGLFVFDLMILDIMMPGETGLELASSAENLPPVILLTALDSAQDRIAGLETGVEDYLSKPFEPRELLLRIQNILKRAATPPKSEMLRFGDFAFDPRTRSLSGAAGELYLTTTEQELLAQLAATPGQPVARDTLASLCGGDVDGRGVDVQIGRLRKKIETDTARPRYIQTVRGAGYRLVVS